MIDCVAWESFLGVLRNRIWPTYIYGPTGSGKTYLAADAYRRFPGTAKWTNFSQTMSDAIALEKDGYINRWISGHNCEITNSSFWSVIESVRLLVIDEIGIGCDHEWKTEMFWRVLRLRKDKPLILTGNIAPKDLPGKFDVRIQSRLCQGQFFELSGRDQRLVGLKTRVFFASNEGAI